ncbi:hypothetical protein [Streptomyces kebangsaanensis]|uniref:Uncharacterized protein n=1 Tax=Streptomyces kebangsaanensis TaxID=864058 RepID=A0ABW6L6A6_9ACTN|nr:hypothetical protein [Streptomyces kebangsaanensis]
MRIPTTLAALALASIGLIGTAAAADNDQNTSTLATQLCNKGTNVLALPLGKTTCKVLTDAPVSRKQ